MALEMETVVVQQINIRTSMEINSYGKNDDIANSFSCRGLGDGMGSGIGTGWGYGRVNGSGNGYSSGYGRGFGLGEGNGNGQAYTEKEEIIRIAWNSQ